MLSALNLPDIEIIENLQTAISRNSYMCCNHPMERYEQEYKCAHCGAIETISYTTHENSNSRMSMRIGNQQYTYIDYSVKQAADIKKELEYLHNKNHTVAGIQLPKYILHETANKYNALQKHVVKDGKPFVKRGKIKVKILGYLLYNVCLLNKIAVSHKQIADLLDVDSISKGGSELISILCKTDNINFEHAFYIPNSREERAKKNIEDIETFLDKYLWALNMKDKMEDIMALILDIQKNKVALTASYPSLIAGAIKYFSENNKLNLTDADIEFATTNTVTKNTFNKSYKIIKAFYEDK